MALRTDHRPWPLPRRAWVMTQTWHDLLFAHWPLDPQVLAPRMPNGLTLDTYAGQAWLGVVPFDMTGIKLRGIVPAPGASRFAELNVRTYVVRDGKPGVFFFSLDAASPLAVEVARRFYHLPYLLANFTLRRHGEEVEYRCERKDSRGRPAAFVGRYRPTGPVALAQPGTLAHWLTERYCLYAVDERQRIYRGEIHHDPWPLQPAEVEIAANTMAAAAGIELPATAPLLHFARRLDVLIWPLTRA